MPRYIKLNLVQNLLEEVKEKEYFVADKMKGSIFENLEMFNGHYPPNKKYY